MIFLSKKFSLLLGLLVFFILFVFTLEFLSFTLVKMGFNPRINNKRIAKNMVFKKSFGSYQLEIDENPPIEFSIKNRQLPPESKNSVCDWSVTFQKDDNGYPLLNKNMIARHSCHRSGGVIFDVTYDLDSFGHRKVIGKKNNFKRHLLTVGCSIFFGQGLNGHQTLASFLQTQWPDTKVYNPSRPGGSVADFIISAEYYNNWDQFEPRRGLALIYFAPRIHIPRFYPFLESLIRWNELGAAMVWSEKDHKFIWKGIWRDYLWWFPIVKILRKSWFINTFGIATFFDEITEKHHLHYARAIAQLKNTYVKIYPESDFVVVTRPSEKIPQSFFDELDRMSIHYLYYGEISKKIFPSHYMEIPYDGHPSEDWNRIFSNLITQDLNRPYNKKQLKNFFKEE